KNEPARMAVGPNRLGGLHQVLDLRQVGVRVAVVHQGVEELHRFPNAHATLVQRQILRFFGTDESKRLVAMVELVEFSDARPSLGAVVAEFFLLLGRVALPQEVVPIVEVGEGLAVGGHEFSPAATGDKLDQRTSRVRNGPGKSAGRLQLNDVPLSRKRRRERSEGAHVNPSPEVRSLSVYRTKP